MIFRKRTGNWAEDFGNDLKVFLWWGLFCLVLVPVLILIILILVVTK